MEYQHLLGRDFVHGVTDCYTLIRDFFSHNSGLNLRDYARPDGWWDQGLNLYLDNYKAEGFEPYHGGLADLRIGDVFLMAIRSPVPCHAGIYVGQGQMLHHFYGRRSNVELYKGVWMNSTTAVVRHPAVALEPVYTEMTLQELRNARSSVYG